MTREPGIVLWFALLIHSLAWGIYTSEYIECVWVDQDNYSPYTTRYRLRGLPDSVFTVNYHGGIG